MARTKAEVRKFLDSRVGKTPIEKRVPDLNGQCVTLIKELMEFLGVGDPYAARGNAKDAGDTYIRNGIGTNGKGWLTVVVNRDMGLIGGIRYGHIWIDLKGEANYESNGARALVTTKNTRPISQGQQFINLDKWIKADPPKEDNMPVKVTLPMARLLSYGIEQRSGSLRRVLGREHKSAVDGTYDKEIKWMVGQKLDLALLQKIYRQKFVNDKRVELSALADDMVELRKHYPGGPKDWLELLNRFKEGASAKEIEALDKIKAILKELEEGEK